MKSGRIIIISGSPGAGKTSVSKTLAECSGSELVVYLPMDDFYSYIIKGYVLPWQMEASEQNTVLIESIAASAAQFADGGYEVILDGVFGPWFLNPFLALRQEGFEVHYIVLRPDEQTIVSRATGRNDEIALRDTDVVKEMWQAFSDLGEYEAHAVDSSKQNINETALCIRQLLNDNKILLPRSG